MYEHRGIAIQELRRAKSLFALAEGFHDEPHACLLESTGRAGALGRFSFLCVDPFWVFKSKGRECWGGPIDAVRRLEREPFRELDVLLRRFRYRSEWVPGLPPFLGGAVGYFGYELLYLIEDIPNTGRDDLPVPDCQLFFFDTVFAWDAETDKTWCIANGFGETKDEAEQSAYARLESMMEKSQVPMVSMPPMSRPLRSRRRNKFQVRPQLTDEALVDAEITPVMGHERYVEVVKEARSEIFAGNCFEVCTTNRFDTTFSGSAIELYRTLRSTNQAPFASYLRLDGVEIVSSSPERFIRLDRDRIAETRPMKGTRPRGKTPEEDQLAIVDLATCQKSSAENIMIVDLARNDLGRVCEFKTIDVPQLRVVETYPYTHQLVSTVRGRLLDGLDTVDLLEATFPGGSMTGAPKVESLKIIDRLEPVKRGIYSGAIGYLDFDGALDLNIVIRTLIKKGPNVSFHVGGAIVADSDPEEEYQETLDKAHGLVVAIEITRERTGG